MRSTFRNPTVIAFFFLLAMVAGKSIIREMMEQQPFAPDGKSVNRQNRQMDEFPIEQCRVTQMKPALSGKLNRLCDECFQTYRVANFFVQCRARCFDNNIIDGCALALYRQDLMQELKDFIESDDFRKHGMTMAPPLENAGADLILKQLRDRA